MVVNTRSAFWRPWLAPVMTLALCSRKAKLVVLLTPLAKHRRPNLNKKETVLLFLLLLILCGVPSPISNHLISRIKENSFFKTHAPLLSATLRRRWTMECISKSFLCRKPRGAAISADRNSQSHLPTCYFSSATSLFLMVLVLLRGPLLLCPPPPFPRCFVLVCVLLISVIELKFTNVPHFVFGWKKCEVHDKIKQTQKRWTSVKRGHFFLSRDVTF